MIAPLLAIGGALVALGNSETGRHVIDKVMESYREPLEKWALEKAFERMGLTLNADTGFSKEAITDAINAGPLAGSGVQLSNIFDRQAVKNDLHRLALAKAVEATGLNIKGLTTEDAKAALREYISDRVIEQVGDGGGSIVDAALPLAELVREIRAANRASGTLPGEHPGRDKPTDFTPAGISNRERQARYRATHTRHWEAG